MSRQYPTKSEVSRNHLKAALAGLVQVEKHLVEAIRYRPGPRWHLLAGAFDCLKTEIKQKVR